MRLEARWRVILVVFLVCAASIALISTLAHGMAAGDQMGISGLEPAIRMEQNRAKVIGLIGISLELLAGVLVVPWIAPGERSKLCLPFRFLVGVLTTSLVSGLLAWVAVGQLISF